MGIAARYIGPVRQIALAVTRTLALYSFAAWAYVALIAVFYPQALPIQLSHFSQQPHTDTFGEVNFVISLASYCAYRVLVETTVARPGMASATQDTDANA
jgi:hypothetical protein